MNAKGILGSKEVWFNALMGVYNALQASGTLPTLLALIPPPWGIVAQAVGTIVLRVFFTSQPILAKPPQPGVLQPPA